MSDSAIIVPIHLDALYVKGRSSVIPPSADFTRLPYFDGAKDRNASVPWLGASAASDAFEENGTILERGIHLHWRFPKALTTGTQSADGTAAFPALPDRWLVTRGRETDGKRVVEDQWVIESNYLYPQGTIGQGTAYPLWAENRDKGRPFRYLGRALPLEQWRKLDRKGVEYLDAPLTAVGYGEPTFAAFYPNCPNVFGFHDAEYVGLIPDGLYYQVIGWYSSPQLDFLQTLFKQIIDDRPPGESLREFRVKTLKERLRWAVNGNPTVDTAMVCNGSLIFRPQSFPVWSPQLQNPVVTFGATITEALSAYLANEAVPAGTPNAGVVKADIEDQLEAIMLDRTLSNLDVDLAAKFKEARHAKGFDEVYSGILWTVRAETGGAPPEEDPETDVAPWPDVADRLTVLNRLQQDYNKAWDDIHAMRRQLYSDWCKYMWSAHLPTSDTAGYPKISEARFLIEQQSLPALERRIAEAGELISRGGDSKAPPQASPSSKEHSLAREIERELTAVLAALQKHETKSPVNARYVVQPAVAPRFWRPTEPVILITGKVAQFDEPVHADDIDEKGLLRCELLSPFADIERRLRISPTSFLPKFPYAPRVWARQPWHPFRLDWEVELNPYKELGNLTTPDINYGERYITHNFTLRRPDADLSPKAKLAPNPEAQRDQFVYKGSSLLTPHVADQFISRLYTFLDRLREQQPNAQGDSFPSDVITDGTGGKSEVDSLIESLETHPPHGLAASMVTRLVQILKNFQKEDFFCLAQRLSGFNDALLMHKQTLQIPIDDPIGFEESRELAAKVQAAAGDRAHNTPQPLKYFSPIRSGELRVLRLRLVSTFGRQLDFTCDRVITATPMQSPFNTEPTGASVFLPPRLVQPARLHFRWLAAESKQQEMNAHPDSTPLCGWVIANHLDNNLFFYSGDGKIAGYMEVGPGARVCWRPAPGSAQPVTSLDEIKNDSLRQLVNFLLGASAEYFTKFLTDLRNAQMRIEPEYSGEPLPMGQPLALVRASLSLEVQGPPVRHQGWREFRENMSAYRPDSDKFTAVRFPIRLGEQDQLNDGLTVYWLEDDAGNYQDNAYIIPNYDTAVTDPRDKACDFLYQAVDDAPLRVTMLIDPRGVVHAATGILPSKAIRIPPHEYQSALKEFEIAFLTAPVLAGKLGDAGEESIGISVIDPPGYRWSWLEKSGDDWVSPQIQARDLFTPFAGPTEVREGWLKLTRTKEK